MKIIPENWKEKLLERKLQIFCSQDIIFKFEIKL